MYPLWFGPVSKINNGVRSINVAGRGRISISLVRGKSNNQRMPKTRGGRCGESLTAWVAINGNCCPLEGLPHLIKVVIFFLIIYSSGPLNKFNCIHSWKSIRMGHISYKFLVQRLVTKPKFQPVLCTYVHIRMESYR